MRYLILSDIHSNDPAFSAVLARVQRKKHDRIVILGDFVGYGAEPNEVIDRVRKMRKRKSMIRGNHDKVVCGLDSGELFNPVAPPLKVAFDGLYRAAFAEKTNVDWSVSGPHSSIRSIGRGTTPGRKPWWKLW